MIPEYYKEKQVVAVPEGELPLMKEILYNIRKIGPITIQKTFSASGEVKLLLATVIAPKDLLQATSIMTPLLYTRLTLLSTVMSRVLLVGASDESKEIDLIAMLSKQGCMTPEDHYCRGMLKEKRAKSQEEFREVFDHYKKGGIWGRAALAGLSKVGKVDLEKLLEIAGEGYYPAIDYLLAFSPKSKQEVLRLLFQYRDPRCYSHLYSDDIEVHRHFVAACRTAGPSIFLTKDEKKVECLLLVSSLKKLIAFVVKDSDEQPPISTLQEILRGRFTALDDSEKRALLVNLGRLFYGHKQKKNGLVCLVQAVELGSREAVALLADQAEEDLDVQLALGDIYVLGKGVPKDEQMALKYYTMVFDSHSTGGSLPARVILFVVSRKFLNIDWSDTSGTRKTLQEIFHFVESSGLLIRVVSESVKQASAPKLVKMFCYMTSGIKTKLEILIVTGMLVRITKEQILIPTNFFKSFLKSGRSIPSLTEGKNLIDVNGDLLIVSQAQRRKTSNLSECCELLILGDRFERCQQELTKLIEDDLVEKIPDVNLRAKVYQSELSLHPLNMKANFRLGELMASGAVNVEGFEYAKCFQYAALAGDVIAAHKYAVCLRDGVGGVGQDYKKALSSFKNAGEKGNAESFYCYAMLHLEGLLGKVKRKLAIQYLWKASNLGCDVADRKLKELGEHSSKKNCYRA